MNKQKPSLEEFLQYAQDQIKIYINRNGSSLPFEQREEVEQDAFVRVLEAYSRLDNDKGWKSFIQLHCRGAVFDYIRSSSGFGESDLPKKIKDPITGEMIEEPDKKPWRLKERVSNVQTIDDADQEVDQTLGAHGVYDVHDLFKETNPRWELIARMASQDNDIHLVGKLLLGFSQTELSGLFRVSRERITQRFSEFCARLDAPDMMGSRWVAQTIFAFGLCDRFNMPDRDLGFGWEYEAVDLWSTQNNYVERVNPQMSFEFDWN